MADEENVAATGAKPSRGIALLLGLIGPWGTGHFYLGQSKRAVLWLGIPSAFLIFCALGLPWLGSVIGYGLVFGVLFVGVFGAWLASLVDLHRVPETRLRRVAGLKVFGYWVAGILFTIAVRLPLRGLVIEAFKIPSGAMQPALLVGDHIMADKLVLRARKPKRGEAIVFKFPEHPDQDFVKRVIAVSGDRLEVRAGHPWLNGWEVPHCLVGTTTMPDSEGGTSSGELYVEYLDGEAYLTFFDERGGLTETQGPYAVSDDEVWVLGDNRNNSHDSRFWFGGRGGGVPLDHVKARALFRWLSVTDAGIDWSRFGTGLADPLLPQSMKSLQGQLNACLGQRPPREKTVPPSGR
jgi:signal peptidase I